MSAPLLDFRNANTLWAGVIAETLARCGLCHAVVCPGSRSTPLALAFAEHAAIEAVSVLDERSAGFFALGLAKQHFRPVVLLCTSGTAAANFLPAVIEASESDTPLLVLTADRPPEMRDCGSGQTIDQLKLYGSYVRLFHELAVPEAKIELLRYVRQTIAHAWRIAQTPEAGPVHLNCPFRDPLHPTEDAGVSQLRAEIAAEFFSHLDSEASAAVQISARQRPTTTRGLIVAGPSAAADPTAYAAALERLLTRPRVLDGMRSRIREATPDYSMRSRAREILPVLMEAAVRGEPVSRI